MSYRAGGVAVLALVVALMTAGAAAGKKGSEYQTGFDRWRAAENGFSGWTLEQAALSGGAIVLDSGVAGVDPPGAFHERNMYNGGSYVVGEAISPLIPTGSIPLNEGIASWNATTPEGTWIETQVRAQIGTRLTKWFNLGVWASDASTIERHSVNGQRDADGSAIVDTLVLDGKAGPGNAYQLKVRLFSASGTNSPTVRNMSFAYSTVPGKVSSTSVDDPAVLNQVLAVPECSQEIYPDGGEVWCSPTSTSMVLGFWGDPRSCEAREHEVVDGVFDWLYDGHGNWPFNTAWAATQSFDGVGMEGYVARFTSMRQLETWIAAGVPVVISYAWKKGDIDGVSVASSNGHLAVVVGFDANGDPVVNDPAEHAGNDAVQRTYPRAQLETQWLETSGGTAYLMYPVGHAAGVLP